MHHIPNIISIFRIILIVPIAVLLHRQQWMHAFILFLIAGFSDGLDGFLARVFNWQSRLGSILDPLADKALLVFVFVSLANMEIIPIWLAVLVVARDIVILLGAIAFQWLTHHLELTPLFISKINTALQLLFVLVVMYHLAFTALPPSLIENLQFLVAITTVASGLAYIVIWSGYAKKELSQKGHKKT